MNYDEIGSTYTSTRHADPRIGHQLAMQLNLPNGSAVVDIGAGTGNYSHFLAELGYTVTAIEPSLIMRSQGKQHPLLSWVGGAGESLPFPDKHFHGAVMTLSLHHLTDWQACIAEALRVSGGGPLVIFAFDPLYTPDFWLFDYFPTLAVLDACFKPSFAELQQYVQGLGLKFELTGFPLPKDLIDNFAAAGWAKPSIYVDEKHQNGISTFFRLSNEERANGQALLKRELANGQWLAKYGSIINEEYHDRGYGFIRITS